MNVQLIEHPLFEQVQQQFMIETTIQQHRIACATPQGLVILKLYTLPALYHAGEFDRTALYETDILLLALDQSVDFAAALSVVAPHLSADDRSTVRDTLMIFNLVLLALLHVIFASSNTSAQTVRTLAWSLKPT